MKTSQKQISLFTEDPLTSLPVDSPANPIHQQVNDLGKRTSDISGRICSEQFKRLTQPTLWAKMFVDLLIGTGEWSSKKCALTWKIVGTKYNRYYCQLVPSVRHTEEIEYGSLLSTPTVQDFKRRGINSKQQGLSNTENWIGMLPTPTAGESKANKTYDKRYQGKSGLTAMAHNGMLPTPRVFAYKDSATDRGKSNLGEVTGAGSHLNPRFVAEMMGFPPNWTELPFQNGGQNQSKDMEMQ
jgi:hypothetical protein